MDAGRLTDRRRWTWRVYGLTAQRLAREEPLRARLLRPILAAVAAALGCQALVLWWARAGATTLFWAVLEPASLLLLAVWFTQRRHTLSAATLVLVAASHAAAFTIAHYGLRHFAGGLLVLTILLCGLLVGAYFVRTWTLVCCLLLLFVTWAIRGDWLLALGWCAIYAGAGWLVGLAAQHLERLVASERLLEERQRSAVVAERTRFAREIHDTLAQGFTGIVQQLNAAEVRLDADPAAARAHLARARGLARESLDEARRSVRGLRPGPLAGGDLLAAMAHIGEQLTTGAGIRFSSHLEGAPYALSDEVEAHLLRIGQEAMTNAVRHARPASIEIHLRYLPHATALEIADDGCGIAALPRTVAAAPADGASDGADGGGCGLRNMTERARQLGGELAIDSAPARGTRVLATIPIA
jgi:signal transduction histidine kinase